MQNAIDYPASVRTHVSDMQRGAAWFFWVATLSVINSLTVTFGALPNLIFGLGVTRLVDQYYVAGPLSPVSVEGLPLSLLAAGVFAAIGYLAYKGGDKAFIVGLFLYAIDAMITVGFKDFFAFGFHAVALFYMFKGLLASRRRFDPSV